jgi:ABC-type nitrate/sulfonate/bicarbonate transport system substrate-binding protein
MRTINRRTLLASTAAVTALPTVVRAQSLSRLVLGAVPEESVTPALRALESGMFRQAGLDVDIQRASIGGAMASGVLGGAYAIGKSALVSVIAATYSCSPSFVSSMIVARALVICFSIDFAARSGLAAGLRSS